MLLAQSCSPHKVSRGNESFGRDGCDGLSRRNGNLCNRHRKAPHGNLDQFTRDRGRLERIQHAMKNAIDHGDIVDSVRENFLHCTDLNYGPVFFVHVRNSPICIDGEQSWRVSHARRKPYFLREILQISSRYEGFHGRSFPRGWFQ